MIVICDKAQDVIIPAGLGDNPGVVYEKSGVESLNGQQGELTLKTVNGNELLGEGDVAIDTGVESLNGQKGALTLKTVNGNELTGEGNIEIQAGVESVNGETGAVKIKSVNGQSLVGDGDVEIQSGLKYKQITNESRQEVYDDVKAHWDNASGYTGDYVYFYQNGVDQIIFDEVKFENNTAYFNSASVGYTSGQVHNPLVRLLCCIVPSEGNIQINENGRVLSDVTVLDKRLMMLSLTATVSHSKRTDMEMGMMSIIQRIQEQRTVSLMFASRTVWTASKETHLQAYSPTGRIYSWHLMLWITTMYIRETAMLGRLSQKQRLVEKVAETKM